MENIIFIDSDGVALGIRHRRALECGVDWLRNLIKFSMVCSCDEYVLIVLGARAIATTCIARRAHVRCADIIIQVDERRQTTYCTAHHIITTTSACIVLCCTYNASARALTQENAINKMEMLLIVWFGRWLPLQIANKLFDACALWMPAVQSRIRQKNKIYLW